MTESIEQSPAKPPIRQLGVLGDIHAEDVTLEAALDFFQSAGVTEIVSVGDIVTGQGNANRCCEILDRRGIPAVCGNHDRWFLTDDMVDLPYFTQHSEMSARSEMFLERLPVTREFAVHGGRVLLCHGLGSHDMAGVMPDEVGRTPMYNAELQELLIKPEIRFTINGHTHHHLVRRFDQMTLINAGTLRRDHGPCLTLVDFAAGVVKFYRIRNLNQFELWEEVELE